MVIVSCTRDYGINEQVIGERISPGWSIVEITVNDSIPGGPGAALIDAQAELNSIIGIRSGAFHFPANSVDFIILGNNIWTQPVREAIYGAIGVKSQSTGSYNAGGLVKGSYTPAESPALAT